MKDEGNKKAAMTAAEMQKFKILLLEKKNEILNNVSSMEKGTLLKQNSDLSNTPIHMADMGTDNYELEHTLGLMESERKILLDINEALSRIDDGIYGICLDGEEYIPKERLKAIPWAKYCVICARNIEKGTVNRPASQKKMQLYIPPEFDSDNEVDIYDEEL